jgi:hypothetical protein
MGDPILPDLYQVDAVERFSFQAQSPVALPAPSPPLSGHFMCYFHRTFHVLTTGTIIRIDGNVPARVASKTLNAAVSHQPGSRQCHGHGHVLLYVCERAAGGV